MSLPTIAPAADTTAPANARKTVVVLGDSLTAGLRVENGESFPALLQKKIDAARLNFNVVNAGIPGNSTADGLQRLDALLEQPMDVLVLELGANDGLIRTPVATIRTNLQAIITRTKAKHPRVQVLLAGMQMPASMGEDYCRNYQAIFPDLARANHAALVPFLLAGVAEKPELNQADQRHPNAKGHKIVAENVWKILEPVLRALNATKP